MRNKTKGFAGLALLLGIAPALVGAADPNAATPEEVVAKVNEAAKYLHDKGLAAFADFNNNRDARWVWKDSYVFIYSCRDNAMIAHPLRPDLVGKPILQIRDDKDKPLFQELCNAAAKPGGGWVEYWWPKPGEGKSSRKISYALNADVAFKAPIQVTAGIYDDTLTAEQLNKVVETVTDPRRALP